MRFLRQDRRFFKVTLLGWVLVLVVASFGGLAEGARMPNIIFVFIDDMGSGDLSCTGNRDVSTVNIDRLASEGVRLTQFYVASPICSPSRVGVTTGQFPARHLIHSYLDSRKRNQERGMRDFLDPSVPTVARTFHDAGYATGHFGKWHMGGGRDVWEAPLPQAYGFDASLVSFEGLGDRILPPGNLSNQSERLGRGKITKVPKHKQSEIYVDRSIEFIKKNVDRPFYLHLWLNDVHDAHVPSEEMLKKYERFKENPYVQKFYAVLDEMDHQVGRLISAVDELGLAEDTLIVLTSDNGPTAWPRYYEEGFEPPGSTSGDRGRKWSLYEGGIRLPLIARWPGKIPAGKVNRDTVMAAVDLFPTFCSAAGLKPPEVAFDGEDLSSALLGGTPIRKKAIYWEYGRNDTYLRPGNLWDRSPNLAIRKGNWKLLVNEDGTRQELYDFSKDRTETVNVAGQHPELAKQLTAELMEWRRSIPFLSSDDSAPAPQRPAEDPDPSGAPPKRIVTDWAETVTPQSAWKEYPRPQLKRERWLNLNGLWDYAIEGSEGEWTQGRVVNAEFDPLNHLSRQGPAQWDGDILVPFCVESALSGVGKIVRPNQLLWYRRTFELPADWRKERILLNFEAVDWHSIVWVNGKKVGEHKGGYDPFSFDISSVLGDSSSQEVVLAVWDPTNMGDQAVGKQSLPEARTGFRYTPTTGIWQTVWVEPVPERVSIQGLKIVPNLDQNEVLVTGQLEGHDEGVELEVEVLEGNRRIARLSGRAGDTLAIKVPEPKLWSPDEPFLYDLQVKVLSQGAAVDSVRSYFGMRKIALGKDSKGFTRVYLNNQILPFQFGPLDQGYWPDGILTPPSDEAAAFDVAYLKKIGCNMVRVHIKVHPGRWYYHCDRLGLLVWQDMVCTRKFESKISTESAAQWELEQRRMIDHLSNHPSVIQWIVFNEGWGQYDTERLTDWTMSYDPTRLVSNASGWTDFAGKGHLRDLHDYSFFPSIVTPATNPDRAIVLGEFGGFNVAFREHLWHAAQEVISSSDLVLESGRESYDPHTFAQNYRRWVESWKPLISRHGLCAGVYTQITDVEHELNGWLTYDRRVSKIDPAELHSIHSALYQQQTSNETVLVPDSQSQDQTWSYLEDGEPGQGWTTSGFDESGWKSGVGPFGSAVKELKVETPISGRQICFRRTFELSEIPEHLFIRAIGRGRMKVYLNGQLVQASSHVGPRDEDIAVSLLPLPEVARRALLPGKNTIGVRVEMTGSRKYFDLGIVEF